MNPSQNTCALLTPPGRGAVAVIGVFGETVVNTVDQLFWSASQVHIADKPTQDIFYGQWKDTGEDVLIVRVNSRRIEIHCHGGQAASASILLSLLKLGCQAMSSSIAAIELHQGNWQADIARVLALAPTEKTATLLLHQYSIANEQLARLKNLLIENPEQAITELESTLAWAKFGQHLSLARSVVLCGQPNVGKSSLVNAIIGFNRAIVHKTAGTTRDVVSQTTAIDGWPIELKDTAGLRESTNAIEKIGIELSQQEIRSADLLVAVFDATQQWSAADQSLLTAYQPTIVVVNKMDLADNRVSDFKLFSHSFGFPVISTSTATGQGISELIEAIAAQMTPKLPAENLLLPVSATQAARLKTIRDMIQTNQIAAAIALLDAQITSPS